MSKRKRGLCQLGTKDFKALNQFLLQGSVLKEVLMSEIGLTEGKIKMYCSANLATENQNSLTLTKKGYKVFYEQSLNHYFEEFNKAFDANIKKEVNMYIIGDVCVSEERKGYAICCLDYKGTKKYIPIEETNCKSPQVIMLKAIYEGLKLLKFPCKVNIHTPGKLGLAPCMNFEWVKDVRDTVFNYELKALCQLSALNGKHEVSIIEEIATYKDEYRELERQLYTESSSSSNWFARKLSVAV